MANIPAVSVVIPMYNAGKYIGECLSSLLAQTLKNFEVVIVDDCSTDDSVAIVQSYVTKFGRRLKLYHMDSNSGSGGMPRNKGIMLSRGEYVFFLDSDDTITKTALDEVYELAKKYDADVVYCEKHYERDADGGNMRLGARQEGGFVDKPTLETENLAERVKELLNSRFAASTCFFSVRRDFMIKNEIFFPNICPSEDEVWAAGLIFYAKRFLRVNNAVYIRRHSEDSVMRKERTPQQMITFWMNPVILGLDALEKLINKHEFFRKNPKYRYAVLENFVRTRSMCFFEDSFRLPPFAVYETIKQKYGEKIGEQDVLVALLCSMLNKQQRINAINLQKFNSFAVKAKKRIDELEALLGTKNRKTNPS